MRLQRLFGAHFYSTEGALELLVNLGPFHMRFSGIMHVHDGLCVGGHGTDAAVELAVPRPLIPGTPKHRRGRRRRGVFGIIVVSDEDTAE